MIKYQGNILYILRFLYKSVIASHSVQFLPFRKEKKDSFIYINPLLSTISIWKALCNRQKKAESKTFKQKQYNKILGKKTIVFS